MSNKQESPQGCTPEALVEKVARAIDESLCNARITKNNLFYEPEARAAIAVLKPLLRAEALEEAAKVCDGVEDKLTAEWRAGYKCSDFLEGASDGANDCAAAIRALIPSGKDV